MENDKSGLIRNAFNDCINKYRHSFSEMFDIDNINNNIIKHCIKETENINLPNNDDNKKTTNITTNTVTIKPRYQSGAPKRKY